MRAAIREGRKARDARLGKAHRATFDKPTNVVGDVKVASFDISGGEGITKDRSGLARDSDGPLLDKLARLQRLVT